jgi:hypothetical protein
MGISLPQWGGIAFWDVRAIDDRLRSVGAAKPRIRLVNIVVCRGEAFRHRLFGHVQPLNNRNASPCEMIGHIQPIPEGDHIYPPYPIVFPPKNRISSGISNILPEWRSLWYRDEFGRSIWI